MVFVRRRRPARGKRPYRKYVRRTKRTRVPRPVKRRLNIHHFKRIYQGSAISASASGNTLGALAFTFNSLPNHTEFSHLFDEYRMNAIRISLIPNFTGSDINPYTTAQSLPNIWSIIDHNDSVAPSTLNELLQYPNCKMTRGNSIHTRVFKPSCLTDVAAITSGVKYKQWINIADSNIPHYGFKYFVDQTQNNIGTWRVFVTYYFSCKGVR